MQRWLVWLLLMLTLGRHYGPDVLSHGYADPDRARRALFYVAGGFQGAALYVLLAFYLPRAPRWLWAAAVAVCAWGALEELQLAACRLAAGIEQRVHAPMWRGLCDVSTGLPLSTLALMAPVFIALWLHAGGIER